MVQNDYMYSKNGPSYLIHYGIKGQQHGIRRFQNEDGTLTEEGKRRYGIGDGDGFANGKDQKTPSNAKQGSVNSHKDSSERMRENGQRLKTLINQSRDIKNTVVPEKKKQSKVESMLEIGRDTDKDIAEKQKMKEDLKRGYKQVLRSSFQQMIAGWGMKKIGQIIGAATNHKTVGSVFALAGRITIGSGIFKSMVGTGAYFMGKDMIDKNQLKRD